MQWQEPRRRRAHMYCYLKHTCSSFQTIIYLILKKNLISEEVDISGKLFFRLPISDKTDGREIALSLCYCLRVSASRTRPLVRVRLSSTDAVHPFGICLHLFCLFFFQNYLLLLFLVCTRRPCAVCYCCDLLSYSFRLFAFPSRHF